MALPVQLTSFVGRTKELDDIARLLRGTRLLTLTGTGGSGKTRLAIEAAARAAREEALPLVWVELAPVSDTALVESAILAALGVREHGAATALEALQEAIADAPLLLILDNCEHVVARCAVLAERLLRGCPHLRILATSREALGSGVEVSCFVPPLSLPGSAPAAGVPDLGSDAVRLFIERARSVVPEFDPAEENMAAVVEICRRVDGIPLAIELAAARLRVLAPEQIAERLKGSFQLLSAGKRTALPRHQTLRATIDWSYQLLGAPEQALFPRLSVFTGSFTIDAAEGVCSAAPLGRDAVLDLLSALVEKSLVELVERHASARYRLLEAVRQYAAERLAQSQEEVAVQRAHAEFYAALVATARPHLSSGRRAQWMARLLAERDNVLAAIQWSQSADLELHLQLLGNLELFWMSTGMWREARQWIDDALRVAASGTSMRARAGALRCAGAIAAVQLDLAAARAWLEDSAELYEADGDLRESSYALIYLGIALRTVHPAEGIRIALRALEAFRMLGDRYGEVMALGIRGFCLQSIGDAAAAVPVLEEALHLARVEEAENMLAITLSNLGGALYYVGELDRAVSCLNEAFDVFRRDPHSSAMVRSFEFYSAILARQGRMADAAVLLGAGERLRERVGMPPAHLEPEPWSELTAPVRAVLGHPSHAEAWQRGRMMDLDAAVELVLTLGAALSGAGSPIPDATPVATPASNAAGTGTLPGEVGRTGSTEPQLRVLALGPLQIYQDGVLLDPEAWASAKPREVLLFLLCHAGGCTKEQIGLALWPDASSAQARNNFHNTLHRLRKTLGSGDWISYVGDRYRVEPPGGCEFDVTIFEHEASTALRELQQGADSWTRLQDALTLYRGDFLEHEVVGDWHLQVHDRLKRLHIEALTTLGRHLMSTEQHAAARDLYQRLLLHDDLNEEAYRQMMICLARLGERVQALRLYQRLLVHLEHELSTVPERETTELFELLQGGREP
jgi:predicted ATPase/DNA-binding SARP family transcriptional activator